jgi:hypothetical protein
MFSWKPFYRELAEKVLTYRNRQAELIQILADLQKAGEAIMPLTDTFPDNQKKMLEELDPFTFFACFNRTSTQTKRLAALTALKSKMSISAKTPSDLDGIPVVNPLQTWFFPYAELRVSRHHCHALELSRSMPEIGSKRTEPGAFREGFEHQAGWHCQAHDGTLLAQPR